MKTPKGKSSSPLDQMQASTWQQDGELLEKAIVGDIIPPATLGVPTPAEQKAPPKRKPGAQEIDV